MASKQKKPVKGKSKTAARTKTASRSRPTAAKKQKAVYVPNVVTRGAGAAVCLFLAVLLLLGMFGVHALVVDLLCQGVKGLIGYGFWVTPLILAVVAYLLAFRRERSVRLRIWCAAFLPMAAGALLHTIFTGQIYALQFSSVGLLWNSGQGLGSGGVLAGGISLLLSALFSRIGAGLLFLLALIVLLVVTFHVTPEKVKRRADYHRQRSQARAADRRAKEEEAQREYEAYERQRQACRDRYEERIGHGPEPYEDRHRRRSGNAYDRPYPDDRYDDKYRDDGYDDDWYEDRPASRRSLSLPWKKRDRASRRSERERPFPPEEELREDQELQPPAVPPWESDWTPHGMEPTDHSEEPTISIDLPQEELSLWQDEPHDSSKKSKPAKSKKAKKTESKREAPDVAEDIAVGLEHPDHQDYVYPSLDLLTPPSGDTAQAAQEELEGTMQRLSSVLASFGIDGHVTGGVQGPAVTRYEVALEQGVRLNKLTNLSDDVALALGVSSVRIAPVPGKISVVGIEVPNKVVTPVPVREVLDSPAFRRHKSSVAFSLGKDIGGNYIVGDCSKLPHMLIAGTTGSGKSVCINSLIVSMLYKSTPEEVRLIMVDPKMVELGVYNGIPHLLIPVVTDPKKAAGALQWAVTEMMKRYRLFSEAGVRDLASYNAWARKQENTETMPKVVVVIDELADLMLVAAKEVEESICRVAQMGRAAGMHLVIATQRPSADVITGLMKANIPSRIAFAVASSLESRIILDNTGAEKLVGKGDMLWFPLGAGKPLRVQGCFISDEEVAAVVNSVKQNSTADYDNEVMEQIEKHVTESEKKGKPSLGMPGEPGGGDQDELFPSAVEVTLELGQASVSMLQRRLKLGYARAARLVDQMEDQGIVGPFEGSKPRQLLITKEQWAQMQNGGQEPPFDTDGPVEEEILPFDPVPQKYE